MSKDYLKYNGEILQYNGSVLSQSAPGPAFPIDGLVARWQFEDNLNDSFNSYTLSGTSNYRDGKVGRARNFVGNNKVTSSNATLIALADNNNSLSVSMWINPDAFDRRCYFSIDGANSSPYKRFWILRGWENRLEFERYRANTMSNAGGVGCGIDAVLDTSTWSHICYVYKGDDSTAGRYLYPYVNGQLKDLITNTAWNAHKMKTMGTGSTLELTVGGNRQGNVPQFSGGIDQVYVYNRALSASEVSQLYNGGAGI